MNTRWMNLGVAASLSLGAAPSVAADRYDIAVRVSHGGTAIGQPRLLVEDGQRTRVATSGDGGYSLAVTPVAQPDGRIRMSADLYSAYGSMRPTVTTGLGQPAKVANGELEIEFVVSRAGRAGGKADR